MSNASDEGNAIGEGPAEPPEERATFLFAQLADEAELDRETGVSTLTLRGVKPTVYFSDRPARNAGHVTTAEFAANWMKGPNSFASNPPNAELVIFDNRAGVLPVTLELKELHWDPDHPDRLRYSVEHLGDGVGPNSTKCGPATLFIDDGTEKRNWNFKNGWPS